jgi:hypothetical protein
MCALLMKIDCESTVTNMPVIPSFEVMSGLFDIHTVSALLANTNTCGSVRLDIRAAGKWSFVSCVWDTLFILCWPRVASSSGKYLC